MKTLDSYEIPHQFLTDIFQKLDSENSSDIFLVERLITGILSHEKPSVRKIHQELVEGESLKTFYRQVHRLSDRMPSLFAGIGRNLQLNPDLAMKSAGVISLDEHLIPHSSPDMEGVDYFHTSSENAEILAHSILSLHYFCQGVEYPLAFEFYRRERELEKWGNSANYRKKNEIARGLLESLCDYRNGPHTILMDSYFMTKENCQFLQDQLKIYISRPKRSWKGTLNHRRQSMEEIYESIPDADFQETCVKNPKTKKTKYYLTAVRDVFFPKIGNHRTVFIKNLAGSASSSDIFDNIEEITDSRGYGFKIFVTNAVDLSAKQILSRYSLRWTIETGYRDMSQNLGLHGCIWRNLSGQYCFIALSFLCYIFLMWAKLTGVFTSYGVNLRTIGDLKVAFRHYLQKEFAEWFGEIRLQCSECIMAKWIYIHVFTGNG